MVEALPAGDRLFGPDRGARGNPQTHTHRPPGLLKLCVVPEEDRQTETERKVKKEEDTHKVVKNRGNASTC